MSQLEKKPWQYKASGSVQVEVPGYSYMTEEDVRNAPRPHSSDSYSSFNHPKYFQATAYEQYMARNMKEWSDHHREEAQRKRRANNILCLPS